MDNRALLAGRLLAIDPGALDRTLEALGRDELIRLQAAVSAPARRAPRLDRVGVLGIHGVMEHRASLLSLLFGHASTSDLTQQLRGFRLDPNVDAVLIHCDSVGGDVLGVEELAREVEATAKAKPVIAHVDGFGASALYWAITAATTIVATPSAQVGSIGVIATHLDESRLLDRVGLKVTMVFAGRYKAEGGSHEPLGDEARREMQRRVDEMYGMFVQAIVRGRKVTRAKVEADFGQGRIFSAEDARRRGLVDRVEPLAHTLDGMVGRVRDQRIAADLELLQMTARRQQLSIEEDNSDLRNARRLLATMERSIADTDRVIQRLG